MLTHTIDPNTNIKHCRRDPKEAATLASDITLQTRPRANHDCHWAYAVQVIFTAIILHASETAEAANVSALRGYVGARTPDRLSNEIASSPSADARKMWVVYENCDARLAASIISDIKEQLDSLHRRYTRQLSGSAAPRSPLWLLLCVTQLPDEIARVIALARTTPTVLGRRKSDAQREAISRMAA